MKKYYVGILYGLIPGFLIGSVAIIIVMNTYNAMKVCHYEAGGKTTVAEFGDGRYAIERDMIHSNSNNPPPTNAVLYDRWDKEILDRDVGRYRVVGSDLYVVGENGYTIIHDFLSISNTKSTEDLLPDEIKIFKNEEKFIELK